MTLRSMTGFGRARGAVGTAYTAEVTAKSVNHRFLELTVRARDAESALEAAIRRVFSRRLSRGKVDIALRLTRTDAAPSQVAVDERLLRSLLERVAELSRKYPIRGELEARDLVAIPQLFSIDAPTDGFSADEVAAVEKLAEETAAAVVATREEEGRRIGDELAQRVGQIERKLGPLEARRDEIVRSIASTLRERMKALFADVPLDSGRLEQEAAIAAERSDVSEELARLSGHLAEFRKLISGEGGAVGKKLDFLSQEILREINTLGSKARDLSLARDVLEMKAETEKIREQVQNLE